MGSSSSKKQKPARKDTGPNRRRDSRNKVWRPGQDDAEAAAPLNRKGSAVPPPRGRNNSAASGRSKGGSTAARRKKSAASQRSRASDADNIVMSPRTNSYEDLDDSEGADGESRLEDEPEYNDLVRRLGAYYDDVDPEGVAQGEVKVEELALWAVSQGMATAMASIENELHGRYGLTLGAFESGERLPGTAAWHAGRGDSVASANVGDEPYYNDADRGEEAERALHDRLQPIFQREDPVDKDERVEEMLALWRRDGIVAVEMSLQRQFGYRLDTAPVSDDAALRRASSAVEAAGDPEAGTSQKKVASVAQPRTTTGSQMGRASAASAAERPVPERKKSALAISPISRAEKPSGKARKPSKAEAKAAPAPKPKPEPVRAAQDDDDDDGENEQEDDDDYNGDDGAAGAMRKESSVTLVQKFGRAVADDSVLHEMSQGRALRKVSAVGADGEEGGLALPPRIARKVSVVSDSLERTWKRLSNRMDAESAQAPRDRKLSTVDDCPGFALDVRASFGVCAHCGKQRGEHSASKQ